MVPWTYPLIIFAAIATGLFVSRRTQRTLPMEDWQRIGIAVGAFIGAMLGAKLPFVLSDWQELLSGRAWFADGKTILTGLAGGYLGVVVAKWSLGIRTRTGDSFAVPVAASVAVGRLGCFVAGCCYGRPTSLPWGVVFAQHDGLPRHPTQLYEAAFLFALGLSAWFLWRQPARVAGRCFGFYAIGYAIWRFCQEFLRDDTPRHMFGWNAAQFTCIPLIAFGLWLVLRRGPAQETQENVR